MLNTAEKILQQEPIRDTAKQAQVGEEISSTSALRIVQRLANPQFRAVLILVLLIPTFLIAFLIAHLADNVEVDGIVIVHHGRCATDTNIDKSLHLLSNGSIDDWYRSGSVNAARKFYQSSCSAYFVTDEAFYLF